MRMQAALGMLDVDSAAYPPVTARSLPRLSPLVSPVARHGYAEDRSRDLPRFRDVHGIVKGVGQDRLRRLGIRKSAGCIVETARSTGNLKSQSTVALLSHEIDAIASCVSSTVNRLPSWNRKMPAPAPAILGK